MQRRAAAIYFVFFLVVGAGAYAYIGVAEQTSQPQYSLSGPVVEDGGSTELGGVTHDVAVRSFESEVNATVAWTNESAVFTAELDNGSSVTYRNDSYVVDIENASDVSSFTLVAEQNVSRILIEDPDVRSTTATVDDTEVVVYANGTLGPPVPEYLPAPSTEAFAVGEEIAYEDNTTTVTSVTPETATLRWTGTAGRSVVMTEGTNATLGDGDQYFAHFPDESSVRIVSSESFGGYNETAQARDYFGERRAGLWGITILSGFAAVILLGAAYLPVRG
jgi:uncharacterized Zn finger protein